ncbi:MAG: glycosyltransferase [Acidobacteria bacterium]|nr:glycosyltransferase [Acidobacteriota bacterium]
MSVVIPTHNRLVHLKHTLGCLEAQHYPAGSYEVIVVDDGSDDETAGYLRELAGAGRVRLVSQAHAGPGAARNAGVRLARGEVIALTDDDCLPDPEWLAALAASYTCADGTPRLAVGGRVEEKIIDGHWLQRFYACRAERQQARAPGDLGLLDSANAACDRSTLLSVGGFPEILPFPGLEDMGLSFRLKDAGCEIRANPDAVVWHTNRTSFSSMIRQAFDRGRGAGVLMLEYPQHFEDSRSARLCGRAQQRLGRLIARLPRPIRPLAGAFVASAAHLPFAILRFGIWIGRTLPARASHYRRTAESSPRFVFYLCLDSLYYVLYLAGQVAGTFEHVRKRSIE